MIAIFVILWVFPSLVVASVASSKGRSWLGFLLLSLVFTPVIGLIVALVVMPDRATLAARDAALTLPPLRPTVGTFDRPAQSVGRTAARAWHWLRSKGGR